MDWRDQLPKVHSAGLDDFLGQFFSVNGGLHHSAGGCLGSKVSVNDFRRLSAAG
jgi:hypothetical protein